MSSIIDNTFDSFKDCPAFLNGEVLLERTVDDKGNHSGFLTVSHATALTLKAKTDADLTLAGYSKYISIIRQVS